MSGLLKQESKKMILRRCAYVEYYTIIFQSICNLAIFFLHGNEDIIMMWKATEEKIM